MLFTIITVCYNAADTIDRTLESVDSQTFKDYTHLIIDGNSTDRTAEIVAARPNTNRIFRSEPDNGLYDAMNKGLSAADGEYLIFLNAGDKFHGSDTLERIAATINDNDHPGIVYGQTLIVDNDGKALGPRHLTAPDVLTLKSFASGMVVCHQAFVVLRRIAGFYDRRYRFSADYEWCIRCLQHSRHNVAVDADYLIDYLNEGITTANKLPSLRERFKIMRYYYGLWPTLLRHICFTVRSLRRHLSNKKNQM